MITMSINIINVESDRTKVRAPMTIWRRGESFRSRACCHSGRPWLTEPAPIPPPPLPRARWLTRSAPARPRQVTGSTSNVLPAWRSWRWRAEACRRSAGTPSTGVLPNRRAADRASSRAVEPRRKASPSAPSRRTPLNARRLSEGQPACRTSRAVVMPAALAAALSAPQRR